MSREEATIVAAQQRRTTLLAVVVVQASVLTLRHHLDRVAMPRAIMGFLLGLRVSLPRLAIATVPATEATTDVHHRKHLVTRATINRLFAPQQQGEKR